MARTRMGSSWHDCRGTILGKPCYIAILGLLLMTIGARLFITGVSFEAQLGSLAVQAVNVVFGQSVYDARYRLGLVVARRRVPCVLKPQFIVSKLQVNRMLSLGFIQSTAFIDAAIDDYDASKRDGQPRRLVKACQFFIWLGLLEDDGRSADNDGWSLRPVNYIIARSLGPSWCIAVEHVLLLMINLVLSSATLWDLCWRIVLPHCFWGGYSIAIGDLLTGLVKSFAVACFETVAVRAQHGLICVAVEAENVAAIKSSMDGFADSFSTAAQQHFTYDRQQFKLVETSMHEATAEQMKMNVDLVKVMQALDGPAYLCVETRPSIKGVQSLKFVIEVSARDADFTGMHATSKVGDYRFNEDVMSNGVTLAIVAAHSYGLLGTLAASLPETMTLERATTYISCAFIKTDRINGPEIGTSLLGSVQVCMSLVSKSGAVWKSISELGYPQDIASRAWSLHAIV